jgi:uncharacterized membrane protein
MNKTIKFAFLASIVINVILAGVLVGQWSQRFDGRSARGERTERALTKLAEPFRSQTREKMERLRKEMEPLRDELREARNEAVRTLIAEPFDEAAHDRQIEKMREIRSRMTVRAAAAFKEAARELPPEQRPVLAEILRPAPPRSPR